MEDKIEAFEMWCLRKMGAISYKDRVTNEDVLKKLKTQRNLLKTVKHRYFGHVTR